MKRSKPTRAAVGWTKCQLAIFDPCDDSEPIDIGWKQLGNSPADLEFILGTIKKFNKIARREDWAYCLAAFPIE